MKITKVGDKVVFEFPAEQQRWNPYMGDDDQKHLGTFPTFTGMIIHHLENGGDYDEIGFAYTIDMDYKGKEDQVSDIVVSWGGEVEDFKKKCGELGIDCIEYPNCAYCGYVLMGSFTLDEKGNKCFDCQNKK